MSEHEVERIRTRVALAYQRESAPPGHVADRAILLSIIDGEPERTRAAVVKALRDMAESLYPVPASSRVEKRADAIENGADW